MGENKQQKDSQSNKYQLTINNPATYGMSHDEIKKILISNFPTVTYFCMADEQGSCYHTHVFINFSSRVRVSKIKKYFPKAHIEIAKGTASENINYIRKSGKWEDDTKHGTQIEGTFQEVGERPSDSRGKNNDMAVLYQMISGGASNSEILAYNQDYILHIDKLDKLRTTLLTDKFRGQRRLGIEVIYVSGETGTGKTRGVYDAYGDENVYRVTDYHHPFDGYSCEEVLLLDEFRNSLSISDMLEYLDVYFTALPARYANKYSCYTTVFIVSNWPLEKQYEEQQKNDLESWKAFLRRIKKVRIYTKECVTTYNSVEEYFNRDKPFLKLTDEQLELPFQTNIVEHPVLPE